MTNPKITNPHFISIILIYYYINIINMNCKNNDSITTRNLSKSTHFTLDPLYGGRSRKNNNNSSDSSSDSSSDYFFDSSSDSSSDSYENLKNNQFIHSTVPLLNYNTHINAELNKYKQECFRQSQLIIYLQNQLNIQQPNIQQQNAEKKYQQLKIQFNQEQQNAEKKYQQLKIQFNQEQQNAENARLRVNECEELLNNTDRGLKPIYDKIKQMQINLL